MNEALLQGGISVFAVFLTIGHAVLIWHFSQFAKRLDALEARNENQDAYATAELRKLESALSECKLDQSKKAAICVQTFVHRDDWVRTACQLDQKMDALYSRLNEVIDARH